MAKMGPNGPVLITFEAFNDTPANVAIAVTARIAALNAAAKPWTILQMTTIAFSATNALTNIVFQVTDVELTIV
jgi:hypothetical protein